MASSAECLILQTEVGESGDCFFNSIYESAKFEGILITIFSKFNGVKLDNISNFSETLRKYVADKISIDKFKNLWENILTNEYLGIFTTNDSIGKLIDYYKNLSDKQKQTQDVNTMFAKYKSFVATPKTYVTEIEAKTLRDLIAGEGIKGYKLGNNEEVPFVQNNKESACANYIKGRLNLWNQGDYHYVAIGKTSKMETPWTEFGMNEAEYNKAKLKYIAAKQIAIAATDVKLASLVNSTERLGLDYDANAGGGSKKSKNKNYKSRNNKKTKNNKYNKTRKNKTKNNKYNKTKNNKYNKN